MRARLHLDQLFGERTELGDVWRMVKQIKQLYPELTVEGTRQVLKDLREWNKFIDWHNNQPK
jgi:hypothetical protein